MFYHAQYTLIDWWLCVELRYLVFSNATPSVSAWKKLIHRGRNRTRALCLVIVQRSIPTA